MPDTDPWQDNVARFQRLQAEYPQATFTFTGPWFYGALRDADEVLRNSSLGRLIDCLLAREASGASCPSRPASGLPPEGL